MLCHFSTLPYPLFPVLLCTCFDLEAENLLIVKVTGAYMTYHRKFVCQIYEKLIIWNKLSICIFQGLGLYILKLKFNGFGLDEFHTM